MSVKRYELTTKYRGNESWDELEENPEGAYVRHGDYAALEQRLIESERYGRQTDITIDNLEMQLNAEREAKMALAAENAEMKTKGRVLLGEACAVYAKLNKLIDPAIGDFVDGQTLHEFQFVLDCETPATDAFLAEVRAQAKIEGAERVLQIVFAGGSVQAGRDYVEQIRKGVQS